VIQLRDLLWKGKLTVNLVKSTLFHATIVLLSYAAGQGQVTLVVAKVEAIQKHPVPNDKWDLMKFPRNGRILSPVLS